MKWVRMPTVIPIYEENTIPVNAVTLVDYWGNGGLEMDGNAWWINRM